MNIIDAHTHIYHAEDGSVDLYNLLEKLNVGRVNTVSLQCCGDLTQNIGIALGKLKHPAMTYGFAGLDHVTGRDYLTQVKQYHASGYDGMKMLEGKPAIRKKLGLALDDPSLDPFYSFLEEKQFPLVTHVADPPEFWDKKKIPGWALEHGWFYDESFIPFEQYYTEVENMLSKHPMLRAIFAHFYFLSVWPDRAQKFLDDHPSVFIDVTAGIEMYENFSKDPKMWRAFFEKNAGRIIFGTDSTDVPIVDKEKIEINRHAGMEIEFLRTGNSFSHFNMTIRGLGLSEETQDQILRGNFVSLAGDIPKPMDTDEILKESAYLRGFIKDDAELRKMDELVKQVKQAAKA